MSFVYMTGLTSFAYGSACIQDSPFITMDPEEALRSVLRLSGHQLWDFRKSTRGFFIAAKVTAESPQLRAHAVQANMQRTDIREAAYLQQNLIRSGVFPKDMVLLPEPQSQRTQRGTPGWAIVGGVR